MFLQFDADFAIGEAADIGAAEVECSSACDIGGQFGVGVAGENHQAVVGHALFPGHLCDLRFARHKKSGRLVTCPEGTGWGRRIRTFECRNQNPVP
jgi:hypothetical protein